MITSPWIILAMFQTKKKIKTHFMFSNFFPENFTFCEMWWNIVQLDRPQMTIWRMFIACWVTKATNSHSEYAILIVFPLQQWLHEHALLFRNSTLPVLPLLSSNSWLLIQLNKYCVYVCVQTGNSCIANLYSVYSVLVLLHNGRKLPDYNWIK
jgi:hypothetical protein